MRGRRRCRLHGGLSTGPTTLEGLARIRAANTRHGRWSAEGLTIERARRRWFANGYRSARAFVGGTINGMNGRAYLEQLLRAEEAQGAALPQFEEWRREARQAVTARDVERLRTKGFL
jgi:hypothetical protein